MMYNYQKSYSQIEIIMNQKILNQKLIYHINIHNQLLIIQKEIQKLYNKTVNYKIVINNKIQNKMLKFQMMMMICNQNHLMKVFLNKLLHHLINKILHLKMILNQLNYFKVVILVIYKLIQLNHIYNQFQYNKHIHNHNQKKL